MDGYIGLGSNLGQRRENLRAGLRGLARRGLAPRAVSSIWETEPLDCLDPRRFLNLVVRVATERGARRVLADLLAIEREAGRVRGQRNAPRELDLDLLLLGDEVFDEPELTVPHPRMWGRRFVLAPLAEIAPDLRHPSSGRSVVEHERELRERQPGAVRVGSLDLRRDALL